VTVRRTLAALGLALVAGIPAHAAEWGSIVPGSSTMESVRAQYGGPTKTETQKVETYDTASWVYEAAQAPSGVTRLVVDFGILGAGGYRRDVVRSFKLEPKPNVFNRPIVLNGWGPPDRVGKQEDGEVFVYAQGLVVIFDKAGWDARTLMFTPPQPIEPAKPPR
jgi:hypothetical protein